MSGFHLNPFKWNARCKNLTGSSIFFSIEFLLFDSSWLFLTDVFIWINCFSLSSQFSALIVKMRITFAFMIAVFEWVIGFCKSWSFFYMQRDWKFYLMPDITFDVHHSLPLLLNHSLLLDDEFFSRNKEPYAAVPPFGFHHNLDFTKDANRFAVITAVFLLMAELANAIPKSISNLASETTWLKRFAILNHRMSREGGQLRFLLHFTPHSSQKSSVGRVLTNESQISGFPTGSSILSVWATQLG